MLDLKSQLLDFNSQQKAHFLTSEISHLLQERSQFYDELLINLWKEYGFADRNDLTLLAVGGYGRKEMFPLSDLDILVLCEQALDEESHALLNHLFNQLWDAKFQLGTSIRTLEECIEIGKTEISVATNMFESRVITGNCVLWQDLMTRLYHDEFWPIADFYQAKIDEKNARYARYHNTSYNLEPDLKHSPGGLRDLHLMQWVILRQYGIFSMEQIRDKALLYPEEYTELKEAQDLLFRMRFGLHLQLKRYDNRLRFDRQLQLSEQLGYEGEGNQPVEKMMKAFFQATQSISQLTQFVLETFKQTIMAPDTVKDEKQPLDELFYVIDNTIYCRNAQQLSIHPKTILDLFFHLTQQARLQVSTSTLRQLRFALKKQKQPLSDLPEARQRFIEIIQQPQMVKRAIIPMHQLGVLNAYLPQWPAITGLMQFDLFHIYTVDEHTIRVMRKIESFLDSTNSIAHPLCCQLFPEMEDKHLLYISALFHDIAKGREGDHAENGALEIRKFAEQHGFNEKETDLMQWLVAEHLTMSMTAQRRDIHDAEVIKTFSQTVKNPDRLAKLTCLTVADICATNESLWNDWKGSLFRKLFEFTTQQLNEKQLDPKQLAEQHKAEAFEQMKLILSPIQHKQLGHFWQPCPDSYFIRNTPTQLVWHALHFLKKSQLPMVLVSNQYARGGTEVFVYCHDQSQLFARIAHTLSQKKVNIHDAQIITSDMGLVFDSFIITESNGQALDELRSQQIHSALLQTLTMHNPLKFIKKPVKHQSFKRKTRLRWISSSQPNQTAFELFTLDRDGLLAQISHIFHQYSLNLINAKITTIGERVEDFFVVQNGHGKALSEEEKETLKAALLTELDS